MYRCQPPGSKQMGPSTILSVYVWVVLPQRSAESVVQSMLLRLVHGQDDGKAQVHKHNQRTVPSPQNDRGGMV